jgi:hypothetical protein
MADYPWMHTYVDGDEMNSPRCFRPIAKGVNEKLRAVRWMHLAEEFGPGDLSGEQGGFAAAFVQPAFGAQNFLSPTPPLTLHPATGRTAMDPDQRTTVVKSGVVATDNGDGTYDVDVTDDAGVTTTIPDCDPWTESGVHAPTVGPPYVPSVSDDVLLRGTVIYPEDYPGDSWGWYDLMLLLSSLVQRFIDPDTWDDPEGVAPGSWTPPTAWKLPAILTANGGGFTRYVERRISALSMSGSEGDRARFTVNAGFMILDDHVNEVISGTTGAGEYQYSGKVMLYTSGAWTVDPDQDTPPDVLTAQNDWFSPGVSDNGMPIPGDLVDVVTVNEIQTVIAACRRQYTTAIHWYGNDGTNVGYSDDDTLDVAPAMAAAEADFPGGSAEIYDSPAPMQLYGVRVEGTPPPPDGYAIVDIENVAAQPTVYGVGDPCKRSLDVWCSSGVPAPTAPGFSTPINTFDDNDTGALDGLRHNFGSSGPTLAVPLKAAVIGDETHLPNAPSPNETRGYEVSNAIGLISWDVTDGFQYL